MVLDGVSKRFGRGPWVLREVELTLKPGSVTLVVGANGCGKSTLLRVVAGVSRPTGGRVLGRPSMAAFAPERLPARSRMSGREYVASMGRLRGLDPADASRRAARLFDLVQLAPSPDAPMRSLSKGNNQKVDLVQAFLVPVDLLILDEPFSDLDAVAREVVSGLIAERRSAGAAAVISSHTNASEVRPDHTFELRGGRLGASGPASEPRMEIELSGETDASAWFHDIPGVQILDVDMSGRRLAFDVPRSVADATLARALAEGWSVLSVRPAGRPGGVLGGRS